MWTAFTVRSAHEGQHPQPSDPPLDVGFSLGITVDDVLEDGQFQHPVVIGEDRGKMADRVDLPHGMQGDTFKSE